ncbi:MAG: ABC transporter permease [Clostridiales bacterium]|nr:ABC transporter permease [Clostridiales bacterium]
MVNKGFFAAGATILLFLVFIAVFADILAPYDPSAISGSPFEPPTDEHMLGTNDIGQDIFSELLVGTRYSLAVGLITTAISASLAVLIGMAAGWAGGLVDSVLMKVSSFVLAIPYIPLILVISALTRGSIWSLAIVMGLTAWPEMARIIRTQTMTLKHSEYITSIAAMGAGSTYILKKHIARELLPFIAYSITARFRTAVLAESTLSFLGFAPGIVKSWGTMLYYAQASNAFLTGAWVWWAIPPGIMITLLTLGLSFVSYSIEGKMDPRLEGRK